MMLSSIIDLIVVNDDDIEIELKMSFKDFIESFQNKALKEDKTSKKNKTKNLEKLNKRGHLRPVFLSYCTLLASCCVR